MPADAGMTAEPVGWAKARSAGPTRLLRFHPGGRRSAPPTLQLYDIVNRTRARLHRERAANSLPSPLAGEGGSRRRQVYAVCASLTARESERDREGGLPSENFLRSVPLTRARSAVASASRALPRKGGG